MCSVVSNIETRKCSSHTQILITRKEVGRLQLSVDYCFIPSSEIISTEGKVSEIVFDFLHSQEKTSALRNHNVMLMFWT